jgi:hypothetical protein
MTAWQRSWLERGGVMPMGQNMVKERPGASSKDSGSFSLATVRSDAEARVLLRLGGSTGHVVWVSGERVWEGKEYQGYHPDADRVWVTLRKGDNQVLVFSNWLFYVSVGPA